MQTPFSITLYGRGFDVWLIALAITRFTMAEHLCVDVIEDNAPAQESAVLVYPEDLRFLASLGVTEHALISGCDAAYNLGFQHSGWRSPTTDFIQSFGDYGVPANAAPFHHYWARLAAAGKAEAYHEYGLASMMAVAGKFVHPATDPRRIDSSFSYGMTIASNALSEYLKSLALKSGANLLEPTDAYEPDLEIDLRSEPIPDTQWSEGPTADSNSLCLVRSEAKAETYRLTFPLQSRTFQVERARATLDTALPEEGPWNSRHLTLGPWLNGETVHATRFRLTTLAAQKFIERMPTAPEQIPRLASDFNRVFSQTVLQWQQAQQLYSGLEMRGDMLSRLLEQWISCGRIVTYDDDPFTAQSWAAQLIGLGFKPERVSALAAPAPLEQVHGNYEKLRRQIAEMVTRMPDQRAYLASLRNQATEPEEAI